MRRFRPAAKLALFAAIAVAVALALRHRGAFDSAAIEAWVAGFGIWAPIVFIASYCLATVAFLPGVVFGLAGGALFGPVLGSVYNIIAANLGAVLAFLVARYLASEWVARRAGPRLERLLDGVESEGWRFVAFVRLVPLFPFNLLNYALGLTRISLLQYVLASLVCMTPGTIAFTYLGYAGREAAAGAEGNIRKALLGLGLLALVVFLPRFVRLVRKSRS